MFTLVRKDRATQCHTHVFNPIRVVAIPPLIILSSRAALHLRYTHIVVVHIALVGKMFDWFEREGYGVDLAELRRREPGLQDFDTWLRESSKFPFSREVAGANKE